MPTASWCVTLTPNPCPPTTVARPHRRYYSISDWAPREMCLPPRDPFSPPVSPTRIAGQAGARGRVQAQRADVRHRRNRARRAMGRLPVAEQRGGRRRTRSRAMLTQTETQPRARPPQLRRRLRQAHARRRRPRPRSQSRKGCRGVPSGGCRDLKDDPGRGARTQRLGRGKFIFIIVCAISMTSCFEHRGACPWHCEVSLFLFLAPYGQLD